MAQRALNDLCEQYHYPLYCYIRRRGFVHHDAQDVLQDFLFKLLKQGSFVNPSEEKGHLRSYLCVALHRFLINWHRDQGDREMEVSVDATGLLAKAEERYLREQLSDKDTPERLFARKWAQELLARVMMRLRDDYLATGKDALFAKLKPVLLRGGSLRDEGAAEIANELGMSSPALRKALERMLDDYRDLLEEEVGQTVNDESEIADEILSLLAVFRQPV